MMPSLTRPDPKGPTVLAVRGRAGTTHDMRVHPAPAREAIEQHPAGIVVLPLEAQHAGLGAGQADGAATVANAAGAIGLVAVADDEADHALGRRRTGVGEG